MNTIERTNEEKKSISQLVHWTSQNSWNIRPKQATFSSKFLFFYFTEKQKKIEEDFFLQNVNWQSKKRERNSEENQ